MSAPPIPDSVVSGLGVDGVGRGYFSRTIPFSKGGGGYPYSPPSGFHWEQVFQGSEPVYQGAQRVYQLVGNAQ